jgi:hypothetical protein
MGINHGGLDITVAEQFRGYLFQVFFLLRFCAQSLSESL